MTEQSSRAHWWGAGAATLVVAAASLALLAFPSTTSQSSSGPEAPPPMPVSVATVEPRDVVLWDEFSGRLEAVDSVAIRSRVAGAVDAVHFREGALVKKGDLLITIDPKPFAAEVARAKADVAAAEARVALARNELDRGKQLFDKRTVSQRDYDQRVNAEGEAQANLLAAQAALQSAELDLGYTEIRAPVSGRVGRLEVTVGNLVSAGPEAPVLTSLVSIDPIYASFNADEDVVAGALKALATGEDAHAQVERIPVEMVTSTSNGAVIRGKMQLIDNQVDAASGTVRVRAVFANPDGSLMPGQFARLRMGQPEAEPKLVVSERAVGTDQDKRFVMVIGGDNKANYREVKLGAAVEGLRVVTNGLEAGERIVVNGLQRVRPGAVVVPEPVAMDTRPELQAQVPAEAGTTAQ
jgi:membrane fusion protein, multidrug efflux system